MKKSLLAPLLAAHLAAACATAQTVAPPRVDTAQIMRDLSVLAADSMEGRRIGSPGSEKARRYLLSQISATGLTPFEGAFEQPFEAQSRDGSNVRGVNLVGYFAGTDPGARTIVVTAHYDHVGVREGEVYNGADDNASGSVALLALARHLSTNRPRHTIVLAWLDGEEGGLRGARAFVADPPVARERIALNVNLDMVGRNAKGELYAAGAHHSPFLRPLLLDLAQRAPVTLRLGHDSPDLPRADDWTNQSDHGAFHAAGIPFVYFGVEDHPDYHRPTDDVDRIEPGFFAGAVETVIGAVELFDRELP